MIVDSAVKVAQLYGVSEKLIGLTILAAGTSLPELATSAVAAFQKNPILPLVISLVQIYSTYFLSWELRDWYIPLFNTTQF